MPRDNEHERPLKAPYFDDSLVINTRLNEIERQQGEERKRDQEYKERQLKFDRLMVVFTLLLVITSIVADAISLYQARLNKESADAAKLAADAAREATSISKKALESSDESFRQSIAEVKRQSAAMEATSKAGAITAKGSADTLRANERFFLVQQRPYVYPSAVVGLDGTIAPDTDIKIGVVLVNSGATPAVAVKVISEIWIAKSLPAGVHDVKAGARAAEEELVIGSHTPGVRTEYVVRLGATEVAAILKGEQLLAFRGTVMYRDLFGNDYKSWFCGYRQRGSGAIKMCPDGNRIQ